ncbi:MAG: VWA domain-containing protein [bacterium]
MFLRRKTSLILMVMLFMMINRCLAEEISSVHLRQMKMDNCPHGKAYVSVLNEEKKPYSEKLVKEDFTLFENGKNIGTPEEITIIGESNTPLIAVLAIDTSGSMANDSGQGKRKIDAAKESAYHFIENMRDYDKVAIMAFNSYVPEVSRIVFYSDKEKLKNQIEFLQATTYNTALYSATIRALESISPQGGRQIVILLTDGKNDVRVREGETGLTDVNPVCEKIKEVNIPIYTIGFGNPRYRNDSGIDENILKDFAFLSHGDYYYAPSSDRLIQIYQDIQLGVIKEYQLVFKTNLELKKLVDAVEYKVQLSNNVQSAPYKINFSNIPGLILPEDPEKRKQILHQEIIPERLITFTIMLGIIIFFYFLPHIYTLLRERLIPPIAPPVRRPIRHGVSSSDGIGERPSYGQPTYISTSPQVRNYPPPPDQYPPPYSGPPQWGSPPPPPSGTYYGPQPPQQPVYYPPPPPGQYPPQYGGPHPWPPYPPPSPQQPPIAPPQDSGSGLRIKGIRSHPSSPQQPTRGRGWSQQPGQYPPPSGAGGYYPPPPPQQPIGGVNYPQQPGQYPPGIGGVPPQWEQPPSSPDKLNLSQQPSEEDNYSKEDHELLLLEDDEDIQTK